MLGKMSLVSGKGYVRVALSPEETEQAMKELIAFNINEMQRVVAETKNSTVMAISQTDAIKLLFEKQGMACYTYLQSKLDEKISKMKTTQEATKQ